MKNTNKKCSFEDHKETVASTYCFVCKSYMCNKCEIFHSKFAKNHKTCNLDKDINEIFTGLCKCANHNIELEYFCKTHNELSCAACLCKIKKGDNGKHKDCEACIIEDIKDEKLSKLKENIKYLEEISNTFEDSIDKIKKFFEKINEDKEELKLKVQKIFTKLRNELNNREDELIAEIDKNFDKIYFKEEIIKESEKLPNKIKLSLEKGKMLEKENDDNQLVSLINDCINIENNIKYINIIQDNVKKFNVLSNIKIDFFPKEEGVNDFLNTFKKFGKIADSNDYYLLNNSLILTKREEVDLINSWISPKNKNPYELIYQATRDGDKVEDFHKKCDNKTPILILGKTPNNYIFGGFTNVSTNYNRDEYIYDDKAFVFSLNQKKRFFSTAKSNDNCTIQKTPRHCIIFGNGGNSLQIENNILTNSKHWSNPKGSYGDNLNLTEDKYYSISELEVFHIH